MKSEKKNIHTNIVLIAIGVLFLLFIFRDFSYTRNVNKSYSGTLYAVEKGRLLEVESGAIQLEGRLNCGVRSGRRVNGTLNIALGESSVQAPFATHANYFDESLNWYNTVLTGGTTNFGPMEYAQYIGNTMFFAKDLSVLGLPLEYDGKWFFLLAAATEEKMDAAEPLALEAARTVRTVSTFGFRPYADAEATLILSNPDAGEDEVSNAEGKVLCQETGALLANATVRIEDPDSGEIAVVSTDSEGRFQILGLPGGVDYNWTLECEGFCPAEYIGYGVCESITTYFDFYISNQKSLWCEFSHIEKTELEGR